MEVTLQSHGYNFICEKKFIHIDTFGKFAKATSERLLSHNVENSLFYFFNFVFVFFAGGNEQVRNSWYSFQCPCGGVSLGSKGQLIDGYSYPTEGGWGRRRQV